MVLYPVISLIFLTGNTFAETTPGKDCASAVTFSGEAANRVVKLLSENCACKTVTILPENPDQDDDEPQLSCTVKKPTDCGDLDKSTCKSGIYKIFPGKSSGFKVFCEMEKHGGGWTVFQRRMNGKILIAPNHVTLKPNVSCFLGPAEGRLRCKEIGITHYHVDMFFLIFPYKTSGFKVFCEMKKHDGGWTVIQRRMNGKTTFYRDWYSYKRGFGDQCEEFWLGNDHLHQLTSQGKYKLRIDLKDFENNRKYALYEKFSVGRESSGYVLDVGGYSGDAGDSMAYQNRMKFSTKDKDNDKYRGSCAVKFKGAWWYKGCHYSNLNGLYLKGNHKSFADGIEWYTWKGYQYSLKETVMMIRKA
ncbi:Hypothetical predicted protein [Mytilus galloprovincialis]|uniref:Fibrinogen C-terminal domain-containing protein n=1 Tax=Mytilus galloprovincialis TaxID=29158 RepID=A0A8B6FN58_MYTGA|nr:Hypothetical predicted protein [Mytilus galloprovincialis]